VVERYVYDAFGVVTIYSPDYSTVRSSSLYAVTHLWQGRPYDSISATYNFRNREVSPTLGRPIQVDMLRFQAGDVNFYRWEGNSPTTHVDPLGLDEVKWQLAPGITQMVCSATVNNNKIVATATDANGNTLELFCDGTMFHIIMKPKNAKKGTTIAACLFDNGVNGTFCSFDKNGDFDQIVHVNAGPLGGTAANNVALSQAVSKELLEINKGKKKPTLTEELTAVGVGLTKASDKLDIAGKDPKTGVTSFNTVCFMVTPNGVTKYRLCLTPPNMMEWKVDETIKLPQLP
jgi:RHS repeat-associated protein